MTIDGSPRLIEAPFTERQVAALKLWQTMDTVHPYTCGECSTPLRVDESGLYCARCGWQQYWALASVLHLVTGPGPWDTIQETVQKGRTGGEYATPTEWAMLVAGFVLGVVTMVVVCLL